MTSRKMWLATGLSVLLGTGFWGALPGSLMGRATATDHGARVQVVRWGDGEAGGEQGEVESPRWGDQNGEQGEVESPRWGDASGEQGEVEAPRWGDQSSEQGEVESPRSSYQGGDQTDTGAPRA
jgi:hypothetical protein